MNIQEKLADLKAAFKKSKLIRRRPWWKRSIGAFKRAMHQHDARHELHHPCSARGTAVKNTKGNPWNIRGKKGVRQESRFAKDRVFRQRYNLQ